MRSFDTFIGVLLLVVGVALLLFFRDSEFGWFSGLPLGIALVVLGVVDVAAAARRRDR